ncbi:hypothetical protein LPJ70_001338 [Coemansia sp. RSA 2708]|nr:hypothetical protein LPJ70_001338 [Coemansia sp. RSA 2708]
MANAELETRVAEALAQLEAADDSNVVSLRVVGGGCINDACVVEMSDGRKYFVKSHVADSSMSKQTCKAMFAAEMAGLLALRQTQAIRVPEPLFVGDLSNGAFLLTEHIQLKSLRDQRKLGRQLAEMHLYVGPQQFGFEKDNWIGSTPQVNGWHDSWVELLYRRLKFQFDRARFDDNTQKTAEELLSRLPDFFAGIEIKPSLVHGDLWSGNCAADEHGEPVIFDPAAYWGHHESELGIMRMFGGYSQDFYDAYHERIPQAPGFKHRVQIYELYHAVNHYNLFGSGYLGQCQRLLERILD